MVGVQAELLHRRGFFFSRRLHIHARPNTISVQPNLSAIFQCNIAPPVLASLRPCVLPYFRFGKHMRPVGIAYKQHDWGMPVHAEVH